MAPSRAESSAHASPDVTRYCFPKAATVVRVEALPLTRFADPMLGIDLRQGLLDVSPPGDLRSTVMFRANCLAEQVRQFHASRAQRTNPRKVVWIEPNVQELHLILVKTNRFYVKRRARFFQIIRFWSTGLKQACVTSLSMPNPEPYVLYAHEECTKDL